VAQGELTEARQAHSVANAERAELQVARATPTLSPVHTRTEAQKECACTHHATCGVSCAQDANNKAAKNKVAMVQEWRDQKQQLRCLLACASPSPTPMLI
jgi:hypothetical protein